MPDIFPGCQIGPLENLHRHGSLCCFVVKNGQLYGLTAKHVAGDIGTPIIYGTGRIRVLGKTHWATPTRQDDDLDAAMIKINDDVAKALDETCFSARLKRTATPLTGIATPDPIAPLYGGSHHYIAIHSGRTSAQKPGSDYENQFGNVNMSQGTGGEFGFARLTLAGRKTDHGDSGGPVYAESGLLIGFVSIGLTDGPNGEPRTRVILVAEILRQFGGELATWANRELWLPEEESDDDGPPVWNVTGF